MSKADMDGVQTLASGLSPAANRIVAYNVAAANMWLLYDIAITMDDEVNLIWSEPWSLTNFVYFIVRYLPLIMEMSTLPMGATMPPGLTYPQKSCVIWQLYQYLCMMIIFMSVEYLLLLRVEALYNGRRLVTYAIRFLYATEVICMGVGIGTSTRDFEYDINCAPVNVPPSSILFGVVTPVFQTILFILTSIKFVKAIKQGWGRIPLAELVMRDGTWAFLLIEAVLFGNGAIYLVNPAYIGLLSNWLNSAFSFVGYRIILNLRRVKAQGHATRFDDPSYSANINFASGDGSFQNENFG